MDMICGRKLGEGQYRQVFEFKPDKSLVVKVEPNQRNISNRMEWELWQELKDTELGAWLAPCYDISPQNFWLVQRRTEPLQEAQLPKQVPTLFADLKRENWGMLNGRVVCHDYGNNNIFSIVRKYGNRLKDVEWDQ